MSIYVSDANALAICSATDVSALLNVWPDELDALSDALDVVAARYAADSVRTPEPNGEVVALADRR